MTNLADHSEQPGARRATRIEILKCPVDSVTMAEAVDKVAGFIASGGVHQGIALNADKVIMAHKDPEILAILQRTDFVYADGMPVIWASHLLGTPLAARVTGIDLFLHLAERAATAGWRIYLLGAKEVVVTSMAAELQKWYPNVTICGTRNGYWSPDEEAGVVEAIRDAQADLLFVAIPSPRKEQFLDRYQATMRVAYAMGVGGTFDTLTGVVRRAPLWMQRCGFEWFYRFMQEPRRLFRRYFITDMAFFGLLAKALFKRWFGRPHAPR